MGKYTKEYCESIAKSCTSKKEFKLKNRWAYQISLKNKWINEWLPKYTSTTKLKNELTYDECFELAKNSFSKSEFAIKHPTAYKLSLKNNWLIKFDWFKQSNQTKPHAYWENYENNKKEAKKYISKKDFAKNCGAAYRVARENGWLEKYIWLKTPIKSEYDITLKNHLVYAYEDKNNLVVYIGLTKNIKKRHNQHKNTKHIDNVCNWFVKTLGMKNIPEPIILKEHLTPSEAQECEGEYCKMYYKNGWGLLNKNKCGKNISSLGSINVKYPYEFCVEISKKYSSLKDFKKNDKCVYNACFYKNYLKDFVWLVDDIKHPKRNSKKEYVYKIHHYTYDECYDEAKKYKTRGEFAIKSKKFYNRAVNQKWLNDYKWLTKYKHYVN